MTDLASPDYYRRRERQALDLADRAQSPEIAQIHRNMAAEYGRLADRAEPAAPGPVVRSVTPAA